MKKALHTLLSLIICVALVACVLPLRAQAYEPTYPVPNLTGNKAIDMVSVAKSQIGYGEDANGGTAYGAWMTEQSMLIGQYYDFTYKDWCSAFFCWVADHAGIARGIVFSTLSASVNVLFGAMVLAGATVHYETNYTPQCGDFVFYSYNGYELGHCAITDGSGNYIHANVANTVVERTDNSVYHMSLGAYFYPVCYVTPNYGGTGNVSVLYDRDVPTIVDYGVSMLTNAGFTVYVTAVDNMAIARASFEVWSKENGKDDVKTYAGTPSGTNFSCTVNPAEHGGSWGEYLMNVTVYDPMGNNTMLSEYAVYVPPNETNPPTISNVIVSDVTSDGFTITCVVADDTAVRRVRVPAWTQEGGTNDLYWHEAAINGNTASVTIPTSAYNGAAGTYLAQIYAYDGAENMSYYDNISVNVPGKAGMGPTIENVTVLPAAQGFTVNANVSTNCTGGNLQVIENGVNVYQFTPVLNGTMLTCSPTLNAAQSNVFYSFVLTAFDANGNSTEYVGDYIPSAVTLLKADLDGDGRTTDSDAFLALQAAAGKMQLTDAQILAADMDNNGVITPMDARLMYRKAAGLDA